jgi:hypothetical protein
MFVKETHLFRKFYKWIQLIKLHLTTNRPKSIRESISLILITLPLTILGKLLGLRVKLSRNSKKRVAARSKFEEGVHRANLASTIVKR